VLHLLPNKLSSLGGRCFAFSRVFARAFKCLLFRHETSCVTASHVWCHAGPGRCCRSGTYMVCSLESSGGSCASSARINRCIPKRRLQVRTTIEPKAVAEEIRGYTYGTPRTAK